MSPMCFATMPETCPLVPSKERNGKDRLSLDSTTVTPKLWSQKPPKPKRETDLGIFEPSTLSFFILSPFSVSEGEKAQHPA